LGQSLRKNTKLEIKVKYEIEYLFRAPGQARDPETNAS